MSLLRKRYARLKQQYNAEKKEDWKIIQLSPCIIQTKLLQIVLARVETETCFLAFKCLASQFFSSFPPDSPWHFYGSIIEKKKLGGMGQKQRERGDDGRRQKPPPSSRVVSPYCCSQNYFQVLDAFHLHSSYIIWNKRLLKHLRKQVSSHF